MTTVSLDVFLAQMARLLDGRSSAQQVEAILGPSPSGTSRLGLYPTLVERQQRSVIDDFYVAARIAAESAAPGRFAKLRDSFLRAHPPSHWAPPRAGEQFGAFLESKSASAELVELVDYAWTRHQVVHTAIEDPASVVVRHYTHRVREFSRLVEREGKTKGRPAKEPDTCLIGRSRDTAQLVVVDASVAALVVLQVLEDQGWSDELPHVARESMLEEAQRLRDLGLLSEGRRAALAGWLPR